jgi:hypothetical protein
MKRIVYTAHDGSVAICAPTDWIMTALCCGGLWDHFPRGFIDTQIERQIARGVKADAARRYANAVQFGGCTTAEAFEIIRDRDCAHLGTAIELWDVDDIPADRWFRDAWRRSHNGGPISIDLARARPIQFRHISNAVKLENQRRQSELDSFDSLIEVDLPGLREKIIQARDEMELRTIWPGELSHVVAGGSAVRSRKHPQQRTAYDDKRGERDQRGPSKIVNSIFICCHGSAPP